MLSAKKELFTPSGGGYQISRSVRLRSSASANFTKTLTTATDGKKWSLSAWLKVGSLGSSDAYSVQAQTGSNATWLQFGPAGFNLTRGVLGVSITWNAVSSAVFRDPSAWYHAMLVYDSTQATSTNRIKIYVNGVQQTIGGSFPSLNEICEINTAVAHYLGSGSVVGYKDNYLAEHYFIDGQALTPSSFGETDSITGVWKPKKYTGTYGTNGFYLNFSDNSGATATTIGKDNSGNSNNWTPNNVSVTAGVTYDSMIDVPTLYADGGNGRGNYAVMNPLDNQLTLSNANLYAQEPSAGTYGASRATMVIPTSGKWYWEHTIANAPSSSRITVGLATETAPLASALVGAATTVSYDTRYGVSRAISNQTTVVRNDAAIAFTTNDIVQCAYDAATGKLWFGKNNAWFDTASGTTGNPSAGTNQIMTVTLAGPLFPFISSFNETTGAAAYVNFGQQPFTYTPPTGFVALNTQNLPTPTISNGASYMAATTYTGTGASQVVSNAVNGVSMQPDWVWFKRRNTAENHWLVDAIRGVSNGLFSNLTNVETSQPSTVSSFNSNGFTVGADTTGYTNANGSTYVAWQWNAGGSTVTNTSGSISAQVRANPTAGFSVVTYTGNGLTNQSVGHGLNATPGMVIIKQRSGTANWLVHHQSQPTGYTLYLNLTNAQDSGTSQWGTSPQTSSLFYVGFVSGATGSNVSASTYVAYCFAAVAGYSAFGSYTGNGSADGPFVFLGFRPKFVMIKRTDAVDSGWGIKDSSRNEHNTMTASLFSNSSSAESAFAANKIDFLSNGFKIRDDTSLGYHNANGGTYIYMAFAENPFKNSLAR